MYTYMSIHPPPLGTDIVRCCACGESYAPSSNYILPFCPPPPLGPNPERNPVYTTCTMHVLNKFPVGDTAVHYIKSTREHPWSHVSIQVMQINLLQVTVSHGEDITEFHMVFFEQWYEFP